MRHGDELEVLEDGFRVSPKSVEPLGIEDGSRCWGLWVRSQREKPHAPSTRHLVISPIHPDYWTSVFHLKLKLADDLGSLAQATGLLSELGINLLFSDCAPSGYRQATFTAICEHERIRNLTRRILESDRFPKSPIFKENESVTEKSHQERQFQEIGATILIHIFVLYMQIRLAENQIFEKHKKDKASQRPFLHYRAIETGPQPWYVQASALDSIAAAIAATQEIPIWSGPSMRSSEILHIFEEFRRVASTRFHTLSGNRPLLTQEALEARAAGPGIEDFIKANLRALWKSHRVEPVSLRGLLTLAYQRVWSTLPQIEFIYDRRAALLRFYDGDARDDLFDVLGVKLAEHAPPSPAIASLHRHDRFIRLMFMERQRAKRLVSVSLKYHSPRDSSASTAGASSATKGLLHAVAYSLAGSGVNMLRLRSQALEFDEEIENGTFQIVGLLPEEPVSNDMNLEDLIRKDIRAFNEKIEVIDLRIKLLPRRKLFLSMPQNATRRDNIVEVVEEVAMRNGFQVIQAHTEIDSITGVTDNVIDKIKLSDAMLQLIVLPESPKLSKRLKPRRAPDFQWLWAEYGMALIKPMPVQRVLDDNISESELNHAKPLVNQDREVHSFSTDSDLRKTLRPIVDEFLRTITDETRSL